MAPPRDNTAADTTAQDPEASLAQFVAGYRPLPGVVDEMMDASGAVRPHWRPLLSQFAALGAEEIGRRFAAADRYLHDSGVFYRVYEDPAGAERPWPLSHVPLIIDPTEWKALEEGLIQRAGLLEAVLADSYGPGELTREGRLPAALVAGNPEFLRPLVGVEPPGGSHLRFCAVDVGRGPDGRWWVLSDRAQAPSGAGYAIENRLALSRAMPDVYSKTRVERVAPFFQAFQAELFEYNRQDDARVCLLTPGPLNETYFEHAFLARYLGLLLVEGEDLIARDDGVFIRTISGLRRTEVLLRRIDADFADPLELNAASRLGVAGLVQAVRDGKVVIANALGAGFVEARALLAFLPALAPHVLGEELKLPNVATWWLGRDDVRADILKRLDDVVIAPAFGAQMSDLRLGSGVLGAKLNDDERAILMQALDDRRIDYVAQEAVTLSTTPVWRDGRLQPRPFTLRLFLARTRGGWQVMPGGFVRIAENADARAVSLQRGDLTADAWVLTEGPVSTATMLPAPEQVTIQRMTGMLPSRAADNLFWVGRYIERAEATLRLTRALLNRVADASDATGSLVTSVAGLLQNWSAAPLDPAFSPPTLVARSVLMNPDFPGALPRLVGSARNAASVIRERFSPDAWRAVADLVSLIGTPLPNGQSESAMIDRVEAALRIIASFSGLAQENMTQLAGWRFLELGRRIERALNTCRFVRAFGDKTSPGGSLDVLLELADSQLTYRQRYVMIAALAPVIDLVMFDPSNPRSVAFQLDRIEAHLAALPNREVAGRLSPVRQIAAMLATRLRTADAASIGASEIIGIENELMKLSETIATTYLTHSERLQPGWSGE
ncbi:circularly permuted type 2 ATP-grasp protein [Pseudolabrys sp. FHR47]|uniref:circularly permuted type 2 ATP-grasp protein n=1 Tax=Pseudolabrys sp. FHR47 TaxID=2562284 RepID=UPI0010BF4270|nr:circularly permuted type 2 ATP-grasp protein [Pseudolabrys sp. FHR47]